MSNPSTNPANRITRLGLMLWVIGALLLFGGLAEHPSENPVFLGRYTYSYALIIAVVGLFAISLLGLTLALWKQPQRITQRLVHLSPDALPFVSAIVGAVTGVVLFLVIPHIVGFLTSPLIRSGVVCLVAGGLLVGYAAAQSEQQRDLNAVRVAVCTWLCVLGIWIGGIVGALVLVVPVLDLLGQWNKLRPFQWQTVHNLSPRLVSVGLVFFAVLCIGGWWIWTYALFPRATLFDDELLHLAYSVSHPLFSSLIQRDYLPPIFYRPFYDVQAGIFYLLAGTNFAAWHLGQAFLLLISLIVFFVTLKLIGLHVFPACLLALVFGSLPAVIYQLNWAIDVTTVLAALTLIVLLLLNETQRGRLWYAGLGLTLLVCPFLKEYGLAVIGGVLVYALEGMRSKLVPLRQGAIISEIALLVTAVYLLFRQSIVGGIGDSIQNNSGFLFRSYSYAELLQLDTPQRILFHVYTVAAHLVSNFLPIFTTDGALDLSSVSVSIYLLLALGIFIGAYKWFLPQPASSPSAAEGWRVRLAGAGLACAGVGLLMPQIVDMTSVNRNTLAGSVMSLISIGIFLGIWFGLPAHSNDRLLALFALSFIIAVSVMGFSYYQERHQYLSGIGWVVLLALVLKNSDKNELAQALWVGLLSLTVLLVLWNSIRAHEAISSPQAPYLFETTSTLCKPFFPDALAHELATRWQVDPVQLQACRAASP